MGRAWASPSARIAADYGIAIAKPQAIAIGQMRDLAGEVMNISIRDGSRAAIQAAADKAAAEMTRLVEETEGGMDFVWARLAVAPDGTLFVAEPGANRVVALPDEDGDGLERFLLDEEGHVAAFAEYGRDNARQCHDPLIVVEILGVDEDLERPAQFVLGTVIEHDIIDGDIQGMFGQRRLHLVGRSNEHLRAFQLFMQLHHIVFGLGFSRCRCRCNGSLPVLLRFTNLVANDLLVYACCHGSLLRIRLCAMFQNLP